MGSYKIEVQVKIVECAESELSGPTRRDDGRFEMKISEADAISIDACEQAVLKTNYEAMRDALRRHLTEVSKKKPVSRGVQPK